MDYLEVKDKIKICLLLAVLTLAIIFFDNLSGFYLKAETYLISFGFIKGSLIFIFIIVFAVLISPILLSPLAVISGVVFGAWQGAILSLLSATLGALVAFFVGRFFLHDYFAKKFERNKIYRKMLEEEHKHILKFIFYSRLRPRAPFDILNYMAGITTMKWWQFSLATFLGLVPLIFILTFFGKIFEPYKIIYLSIIVTLSILYFIYKIIRYKKYYVKGY